MNSPQLSDIKAEFWHRKIDEAVAEPDRALSNFKITALHYQLGQALSTVIGSDAGANFHSWAVWGSRKAGVTIRQEDLDCAMRNAYLVSSMVGSFVGAAAAKLVRSRFKKLPSQSTMVGSFLGTACGGWTGKQIAIYSRERASVLILEGNQIVLEDIGKQTARFIDAFHNEKEYNEDNLRSFISAMRPGDTASGGQELLRRAFSNYYKARYERNVKRKHEHTYLANCQAVLHEHIRLEPYIRGSLPMIIRKCATQRLMTFDVGTRELSVGHDVPALNEASFPETLSNLEYPELLEFLNGPRGWNVSRDSLRNTAAKDWTRIRERMGYIVNLFRSMHTDELVLKAPFPPELMSTLTLLGAEQ